METRHIQLRHVLSLLAERGPLTLATMAWGHVLSAVRRRILTGRDNVSIAPGVDVERGVKVGYEGRVTVAEGCSIGRYSVISPSRGAIRLGRNSLLNVSVTLLGNGGIDIGENVLIGPNTAIVAANHEFERTDRPINTQGLSAEGITIHDDVWIGATCTILDGVTLGEGAVVAAGSVVTSSVPENAVVAGVPAEVVDTRT